MDTDFERQTTQQSSFSVSEGMDMPGPLVVKVFLLKLLR